MQQLSRGSRGAAVTTLQRTLKALGGAYSRLAVDGVYGPETEARPGTR
jgi:peptidoglycan hydrolase-like protein with peptidoglycan-binding domain